MKVRQCRHFCNKKQNLKNRKRKIKYIDTYLTCFTGLKDLLIQFMKNVYDPSCTVLLKYSTK